MKFVTVMFCTTCAFLGTPITAVYDREPRAYDDALKEGLWLVKNYENGFEIFCDLYPLAKKVFKYVDLKTLDRNYFSLSYDDISEFTRAYASDHGKCSAHDGYRNEFHRWRWKDRQFSNSNGELMKVLMETDPSDVSPQLRSHRNRRNGKKKPSGKSEKKHLRREKKTCDRTKFYGMQKPRNNNMHYSKNTNRKMRNFKNRTGATRSTRY